MPDPLPDPFTAIQQPVVFELKTTIYPGNPVGYAYPRALDPDTQQWETNYNGDLFTVADGTLRTLGKDDRASGLPGALWMGAILAENGDVSVAEIEPQARLVSGVATGPVSSGASTFTLAYPAVLDGGLSPPVNGSGYLVVTNYNQAYTAAQQVIVYLKVSDGTYHPFPTTSTDLLHPFEIEEDLVPASVDGSKVDTTLTVVIGHLLDDPGATTLNFYPEATPTEAADGTLPLSLGVGHYSSPSYAATRGWAKWVAAAYLDESNNPVGQWQIVSFDASLVVLGKVTAKAAPSGQDWVERLALGDLHIWWNTNTAASPTLGDSDWEVAFFNASARPLPIGETILLFYDRTERVWNCAEPVRTDPV